MGSEIGHICGAEAQHTNKLDTAMNIPEEGDDRIASLIC